MSRFLHPSRDEMALGPLLAALSDPRRLCIVRTMAAETGCLSCIKAAPDADMPKSTLSHHFRILREAGLILTTKKGVEHRNILRTADLEAKFPGLLQMILRFADQQASSDGAEARPR